MMAYIIRRIAYSIPILLGVNILIFILFFFVNTPNDMAVNALGGEKFASPEQIENWKREHEYNLPRMFNANETFPHNLTRTIYWRKSIQLFMFRFGKSDMDNTDIGKDLAERIPYSLCITIPIFLLALFINLVLSMVVAFYRGTYVDATALVICVIMMSISALFYIIGGQYIVATRLKLTPVSGFEPNILYSFKFLILPVMIGFISRIGAGIRYYRTVFLEEINKDYVRTARAKGLGEGAVLFKHALKNAMLPILTSVVVQIPFLIMGSLLLEKFFGIPGLGSYMVDGIAKLDFAIIRSMVFLGSLLYVAALVCVDISYTLVDPRIRLQ
jgi:peptide/nickel transport system permease protein